MSLSSFPFTVRNQSLLCCLGLTKDLGCLLWSSKQERNSNDSDSWSFFSEEVNGPQSPSSLSFWICTEESGSPAWSSWCCWQDPHAACSSNISSSVPGPRSPRWISIVQSLPQDMSHVLMVPSHPFPWWGHQLLTRRRLPWKAGQLLLNFCLHGTELMGEQTATLQLTTQWRPLSPLTVPSWNYTL